MDDAKVVGLLKRLVSLPSVNPDHTDEPAIANEFRVADFLAAYLAELGFTLSWDEWTAERKTVIGTFGRADARHTLLLEAHTDTVGVKDMVIPPFEPTVRDGRLYGRGACDTKGPMAAALIALDAETLAHLQAVDVKVVFVGAFGEEKGNIGGERLVEQGVTADAVVVLEPTDCAIVHAHKGALWFEIEVIGQAGHGSAPEKGKSAIFAMADMLSELRKLGEDLSANYSHPDVGRPTLNVGVIQGGVAVNIVPHTCTVEVDCRLIPGQDFDSVLSPVRSLLKQLKQEGRICAFDLRVIKSGAPYWSDPASPLARQLQAAINRHNGPARCTTAAWYSDAGAFARVCEDVLVFGPGSIAQAHTVDEYIMLDELQKGTNILRDFLRTYKPPSSE